MKKALIVDCCIRGKASRTKQLLEAFCASLSSEYEREYLDLQAEQLRYFTEDYLDERQKLLQEDALEHPRFRYAHQFAEADLIVIAAPFWDLSFPALLKVYIEQVSLDGITFTTATGALTGSCRAERMVFLTTRGGFYTGDAQEMGSRYLDALHTFFGIGAYSCIAADGMDVQGYDSAAALKRATEEASALAASL